MKPGMYITIRYLYEIDFSLECAARLIFVLEIKLQTLIYCCGPCFYVRSYCASKQ